MTAIAESAGAAPAPAISEETQRLLATDATEFDAELLDIYLTEAHEVLDTIAAQRVILEENHGDREALRTARRQFHTLKGSGRMVGLTDLGEIAFEVEKIHNRLLEEERVVTPAVLAMIAEAERSFRTWVGELSASGRVSVDAGALHAAIAAVEAEMSPGRDGALEPPPPPPPKPELREVPPPEPVLEIVPPLPPAPEFLPPVSSSAPVSAPAIAMPLIELPEVGAAPSMVAAEPALEMPPAPAAAEKPAAPVDDITIDIAPPAPVDDITIEIAPQGIVDDERETDEVVVGDVTLSAVLFGILIEEAAQHLATLARELEVLQFDSKQTPSAAMVRASHTLCGIHRTGGFPLIAVTAKSLEQALLALQQREPPLPGAALPVLTRAVEGLRSLVARVRDRAAFAAADAAEATEIQGELEGLRQESTALPTLVDAESQAEDEAARDEHDEARARGPVAVPRLPERSRNRGGASRACVPRTGARGARASRRARDRPDVARRSAGRHPRRGRPGRAADLPRGSGRAVSAGRRAAPRVAQRPSDLTSSSQLRRTLHTFKGSARMAGAMRLGELTHRMESRLDEGGAPAPATPGLLDALDDDLDHIAFVLEALREGKVNVALPTAAAPAALAPPEAAPAPAEAALPVAKPTVVPLPPAVPAAPIVAPLTAPVAAPAAPPPAAAAPATEVEAGQRAQLRVRADMIDRLVNEAGEVAIARSRVEGELRALKSNLLELTGSVIRLRAQVREIEIQGESQIQSRMSQFGETAEGFDPLEFDRYTRFQELTRSLAEGVNDVSTVQQSLLKNLDDADAALVAQARLSRDVQQQLFSIRTVPFGSLSERLYRILRATAKELDKRANLEIRGGQTELDRSVLEKLVGPLEHLLRNALDHGIESRAARAAAGKAETGEIALTVRQVGNEIAIELTDDGGGLNLADIRAKAVAQGRMAPDAQPTDAQLIECIFQPGFTTASKVTQVSGRGIGMDVVRAEIAALGGRVEVTTRAGAGTSFLLYLPLTLAVAQAVLVRAGGRLWALPAPMVEQVQQVKAEALVNLYVARQVDWQGKSYPFHYLPRLLGDLHHNPETARYNPVLLLRAGQNVAAVHVDEMIGNQEVVVKNIGPQLARVSGIAGATVLGSGEIVLIINPVQLAQRPDLPVYSPHEDRLAPMVPKMTATAAAASPAGPPLVMIVDDSLTVRKITSRTLTRAGFDVVTAKDGIDALELLGDQSPDVILLDIEMPRMDGFEFTKTIKGDPKHAHIPIIMITSRTAEKHRNRAKELGVDLYLGKPYQEDELIRNLREMLALTV